MTANALEVAGINHRVRLNFLAERMDLQTEHSAQAAQMMDDWRKGWQNPRHFRFVAFRDEKGDEIPSCFKANGDIKEVESGSREDCRPDGVKYLTVMTELLIGGTKRMTFRQSFELPQTTSRSGLEPTPPTLC